MKERLQNLEKKFQNQVFSDQTSKVGYLEALNDKKADYQLLEKQKKIKEMAEKLSKSWITS